jgi:hypothetical protein
VICLRNLCNEHLQMMTGCLLILAYKHVLDDLLFGALQFTSDEVESVLQDLDDYFLQFQREYTAT